MTQRSIIYTYFFFLFLTLPLICDFTCTRLRRDRFARRFQFVFIIDFLKYDSHRECVKITLHVTKSRDGKFVSPRVK